MVGTNAYAVLGDQASNRARAWTRFGGVALIFRTGKAFRNPFAVLHVPILPRFESV
jgi:hypothetical protein